MEPMVDLSLMGELLGDSPSFVLKPKADYDLVVLDAGFKDNLQRFMDELGPELLVEGDRPLVFQLYAPDLLDAKADQLLVGIADRLEELGRPVRFYPAGHAQKLSCKHRIGAHLRPLLREFGLVPEFGIDPEIVEAMCVSLRMGLEVQFNTSIEFGKAQLLGERRKGKLCSGSVDFHGGDVQAGLLISLPVPTLRTIMERMIGSLDQVSEDVIYNGVTELVNITGGRARGMLNDSGYSVKMSAIPSLITPDFQDFLGSSDRSYGVSIEITSDAGPMYLEVRFYA